MGHKFNLYLTENSMRGRRKMGKGRGRGREKSINPPPFFPFSLSTTPFDACYAGHIENKITVATI